MAAAMLGALLAAVVRLGVAFDVRVSKGFYTRPYEMVRLSVIGGSPTPGLPYEEAPSLGASAYHSPFIHRWTTKTLQSKLVSVGDGGTAIDFSAGESMLLRVPPKGSGVTGLFFSDPCFTSRGGFKCPNGKRFRILERLTFILNRLLGSDEFDFWGILGDNFYDILGGVSSEFFAQLSLKAKSKPLLAVVGNHDLWLGGQPPGGPGDELGYGFMQFYGQDTVAGLGPAPYNFAGNPDGLEIAHAENFIYGTQLGDLAFFSFSSAHDWQATNPHAVAFCDWVGREPTVNAVVILGHWDVCDLGCKPGMDTPSVYARMKTMSGCSTKRMLLIAGHQHCNRALEGSEDPLDAHAFVVGGAGMWGPGCSQFGFTVLQSHPGAPGGPNVRVDHFPVAASDFKNVPNGAAYTMIPAYEEAPMNFDRFEALAACLNRSGYVGCRAEHGQSLRAMSKQDIVTPRKILANGRVEGSSSLGRAVAATQTSSSTSSTSTATATSTRTTATSTTCASTTATTRSSTTATKLPSTTEASLTTLATSAADARRSPVPPPPEKGSDLVEPLDFWVTTSALERRATSTTDLPQETVAEVTATALRRRATSTTYLARETVGKAGSSASPTGEIPRPGARGFEEHHCWQGLEDPDVAWLPAQVEWCCRELGVGCHKAVPTAAAGTSVASADLPISTTGPASAARGASTSSRGPPPSTPGETVAMLEQVLERKPHPDSDSNHSEHVVAK